MGKKGPLSRDQKHSLEEARKQSGETTPRSKENRCTGPREELSLEGEVTCSLPQPHLRPVQKSSCHLTCLVTVIINSLAGREKGLCDGGWACASPFRLLLTVLSRQDRKHLRLSKLFRQVT